MFDLPHSMWVILGPVMHVLHPLRYWKWIRPSIIHVIEHLDFPESYLKANDNSLVYSHNQCQLMPDVEQCGRGAFFYFAECREQLF